MVDADTLVVSDVAPYRHVHFYHDLHRWSLRRGDDGAVSLAEGARLSQGWRAQQPDVSPDGDHVAYTVNHRGTTALFEMSLTERTPRAVFRPRRYEQVYAPRYAPDGRTVAFSWWRRGGRRDIALWHRETGEVELVTDDVALDLSPAWSPDGRYLLWSSDRTGVSNGYGREVATRRTWQVTNVLGGAFQPVVSPDGNTLVYVGYSARRLRPTWTPTYLNLFVFWIFEIPLAYLLAYRFQMGPEGVFWAITIAFSLLAIASGLLFRRGKWKLKTV